MAKVIKIPRDSDVIPKVDISIKQGSTYYRFFGVVESLDPLTYMDLTGWSARAKIKSDYDGATWIEMTDTNGRIVLGLQGTAPNQYNVLINLSATITDALNDWGYGMWDLELQDTFGRVYCLCEGQATLNRAVTK